ncbi:T9SS type A sorting domain-containing protein [Chitinophaga rhizophila]|uniref:T9SS type A sorting domain-containing protein n=1 Tax=Chitinophaga rhizophila TaxID=2866212 RepID=A0ABS7GJ69_9BACT|nr:T9SS type A sorting domain-containing protein [Chitinophaga rhizophila]MBW8687426.1 T9SS type A sorting domain-containing protein [Chitinophaga rhizophila]
MNTDRRFTPYYFTILILLLGLPATVWCQTSWRGTVSTVWNDANNWTAGIPTASIDAVIGDAAFTGSFQPTISSVTAACRALTLVAGAKSPVLTVAKGLTVSGTLTNGSGCTISHRGVTITVKGDFINNGTYTTTSTSSRVTMAGTTQSISGTGISFRRLTINSGATVTPAVSFPVTIALSVSGNLIPSESTTTLISGAGTLSVTATGVLHVRGATFASNYSLTGTNTLSAGSTVDYSATLINQTIRNDITYSTLRISGALVKTLAGNLNPLNSTTSTAGRIVVASGVLNLSSFTANRGTTVAGGALSVANDATLRIGGTNTFPSNFATRSLSLTSTVEYNGAAQTISAETYGNLVLSGSSGAVIKTMPATAFTVAGNFTTTAGSATSLAATAGANMIVTGNTIIETATTFNAGSFTLDLSGNWVNNGVFSGGTGTVNMNGPGTNISGTGVHGFNNLNITATNISATANAAVTVAGNLATTGPGAFTQATGGTLTMTGASKTITGASLTFDNLTISGTVSTTSSLLLNGNLVVSGTFNSTGGTITMQGAAKTISGAGTIIFGSLVIPGTVTSAVSFSVSTTMDISGTFSASAGTTTFTGTSTLNGTANLFNVTLNGTSLQLSTNAVLGIANTFTVTAGTLNVTSTPPNTVNFNGTAAQTINALTYNRLLLSGGSVKTAAGAITTSYFTLGANTTFNAGAFTHTVLLDFINSGTFNAGTGTFAFTGANISTITGITTFNILTLNKNAQSTQVNLNNDVNAATINMTSGTMNTGVNVVNMTVDRTGPGIILGNIRRTQSFGLGGVYAFESPNTTLTILGLPLTGSITVSVAIGPINDFPQGSAINRVYTINTGLTVGLTTVRLHYEDAELNGNNESTMGLWYYSLGSWGSAGKSGNSTTANYVEVGGRLAINGRWTISDNSNVVRWNGSVSNEWTNANNWTVVQGSPSRPPGVNDIVEIGTSAFTNQPVISTAVAVKAISLGSTQAVNLSLASGGSLTTQGNIAGRWSGNATHTINTGAQTLTVNGDLPLSDGTSGRAINLNIGSGTVTVGGSVTQTGGAAVVFSGAGTLNIGSNYDYSNGTFTAGNGTVNYNGSGAQTVAGLAYYNLQIGKSAGDALLSGEASASGSLNITGGALTMNGNTTVTGDLNISPGATLNSGTIGLNVGGNWNNSGTFSSSGGTVTLNGSGIQTVSATTFNNLVISSGGTVTLAGNSPINGNLSVNSGILNLSTFSANRASAGGTFSLANGATLQVGGTNNFPSGYSTYTLGNTSTTNYNGSVAQAVAGVAYGNLVFNNNGTKTLAATCIVNGDLTINSGATFSGAANTINLFGNWNNSGTYTPASSTVTLNGSNKTITGNTTFNRLTAYGSYIVNGSDITYNGLLTIANGGSYNGGSGTAIVNGDLTNNGSLTSNGVTTFTGTTLQTIRFVNALVSNSSGVINFNGTVPPVLNSTSTPTYATLNINNTGGVSASVGWIVQIAFNISNGATFNGGISTHNVFGSFTNNGTVTSSGTMNFTPTAPQTVRLTGTAFTSTGTVQFGGSGALSVTGAPTALNNVLITNTTGVTPSANWLVNGDFMIANNAIFNAGSYTYTIAGDLESNGTLNGGTSTFTLTAADAQLTGSPSTTFYDLTITGFTTALSDYGVGRNFTNNGTYDGTVGALNMVGNLPGTISGAATSFNLAQVTIQKDPGTTAFLGKAITAVEDITVFTGTLDAAGFAITPTATASLTIEDNARLILRGTQTLPTFSSFTVDTFSTVEYGGSTQAVSAATSYGNLVISSSGTKTASAILKILNDFTLSAGTFVQGSFTDTLGGNWTMSGGTYNNTGATIYLNGAGTQTITSTGAFNNLTVNKATGIVSLGSNITVNSVLNFILNKIVTGATFAVIQPTTGVVTGASQSTGWVVGRLQKAFPTGSAVRNFEVGDIVYYSPASIAFGNVTVSGSILVGVTPTDHPNVATSPLNPNRSVNRYWSFTNNGANFNSATVTMTWNATDVDPGSNTSNFKVSSYNGSTWATPAFANPLPTSIQATGLTNLNVALAIGQLIADNTWTGAVNVNWYVSGNWSNNSIPVTTTNATIPSGLTNYPQISTGTATTNNLIIQNGASVTVNGGILQIYGAITNTGSFTASNGSIEMTGTAAQIIPANTFTGNTVLNLTTNNVAGVTLLGPLNISGVLKANIGLFATGANLTLLSTAARTALIDGSGNGSVLGTVTIQRYRPTSFGYTYFSSPFSAATVSEFSDDINLNAPFPNFYRYIENRASSGWVSYTSIVGILTPMVGYAGNLGVGSSPVTIDMTGVVNNGTMTAPTPTNNNQPYTQGFNLVGNPYPSPIDWDATNGWTRTNIDDAIYFFNAGSTNQYTGTYSSYINGVSSDGIANNIIPTMQGFFIHVTDGTYPIAGLLRVTNAARVNNLTPSFRRERPLTEPLLRLTAAYADEGHPADPAVIYFDDSYSKEFEPDIDALKMLNTDEFVPSLYIMAGKQRQSISAWPNSIDSTEMIPLGITTGKEGYVSFSLPLMERMPADRHFYLYDKEADITHDLHQATPYRLFLRKGSFDNRFFLVLKAGEGTIPSGEQPFYHAYSTGSNLFAQFDKVPGEKCTITVSNISGQVLLQKDFTGNGRYLLGSQYSSGIYIITFSANRHKISKKVFIAHQ